ncbi:MAG: hypothetical protein NT053_03500, partial [Cyanobacteria bacterium]|nr:hypothetical protein [Cyanobacteriota bacterium]
ALAPGKHTLEFDFKYAGLGVATLAFNNLSGLGRSGTGTLKVDGKEVATQKMEKTLPMILQWDESFDIGSDTLTGVNDADYQPPFPLTAKLNKLTIKVDGKVVATKTMTKTLPMTLQWDESFDIGSDTLTGVNDADYQPPFRFTGTLNKLTIKTDRPQLSAADIKSLEAAMRTKAVSE